MGALPDAPDQPGDAAEDGPTPPEPLPIPPPPRPTAAAAEPPHARREHEPPEEYLDPISGELMLDPVLLVESGQSYDRATITAWFQRCREGGRPCTDPLTGAELRATTTVANFSLKSLIASWAERAAIPDLPAFSRQLAKQRSARGAGSAAAAAAAAELAAVTLGGCGSAAGCGEGGRGEGDGEPGSSRPVEPSYPDIGWVDPPPHQPSQQQQPSGALSQQQQQQPASHAQPPPQQQQLQAGMPDPGAGMYPSPHQPAPPVSKLQAAETALAALRDAASGRGGGGSQGAAAYHAWSLMQLAADGGGRDLLWEGNAIPLAIFVLGGPQQAARGGAALDAAKPALCGLLQRMGARDADVAASIAQCGGVQALVAQLTAEAAELRAAAARALYFLGWQGSELRAGILEALAAHAAACRLPARPLLAFWRFWEARTPGGASSGTVLAQGREAEWDALALVAHMLAEGCAGGAADAAAPGSAAQQQLVALDVAASAVPAVLARGAAASEDAAVRFAALSAARTLGTLPANLPLLLDAALREGSAAAAAAASAAAGGEGDGGAWAAGHACGLAWELAFNRGTGGSAPAAVQAVLRRADLLLDCLEAALGPGAKPAAEGRWLAAGLAACLTAEPPPGSAGVDAAAAADGARALLATHAASAALQRLVALAEGGPAAANPRAATAAALALGNIAAYRAAAASPPVTPRTSLAGGGGPGSAGGSGNYAHAAEGAVGRLAARAASKLAALKRQSPGAGAASPPATPPAAASPSAPAAPTDPRGALLHRGAMQRLVRLALQASAGAARADADAAAAAAAGPRGSAAAAAAGEAAAAQRRMLAAALQALNNLCVEQSAARALQAAVRAQQETQLDWKQALTAAMGDAALVPAARELARRLLLTQSGAPGQRHSLACGCEPPPARPAAYPTP